MRNVDFITFASTLSYLQIYTQTVADPGSPRGRANPRIGSQPIICHTLCLKLHENERNWIERNRRPPPPHWIRQCQKSILGLLFFGGFTDYVAILISKHEMIILGNKTFFIIKYQSIIRNLQSFKFCNEKQFALKYSIQASFRHNITIFRPVGDYLNLSQQG